MGWCKEKGLGQEPREIGSHAVKFLYRDYIVPLSAFAFLPLWGTITTLTFVGSYTVERQWVFRQALYYLAILGTITVMAPVVKLWILKIRAVGGPVVSPRRLLLVTIMETFLIYVSVRIAVCLVFSGGPLSKLQDFLPEAWIFIAVFIVMSGLLSVVPNMALVRARISETEEPNGIRRRLVGAGLIASIAPIIVTAVVIGCGVWR
jgi:hypothetical protein